MHCGKTLIPPLTVYIAVILLLDSRMEAILSAAKRTAHA